MAAGQRGGLLSHGIQDRQVPEATFRPGLACVTYNVQQRVSAAAGFITIGDSIKLPEEVQRYICAADQQAGGRHHVLAENRGAV